MVDCFLLVESQDGELLLVSGESEWWPLLADLAL